MSILGSTTIEVGGRPIDLGGPRQRELVALLVLGRNQLVPVDDLADRLWPDELPATATKTVQVYVSRLRTGLGADAERIETLPGGYRLRLSDDELDAARFEALARTAHGRLASDPLEAESAIAQALAVWRGPALADVAALPFARAEADRLNALRADVLDDLDEIRIRTGRAREAIVHLRAAVREHPEREGTWARLMRALYADGRQVDALAAYRDARTYLSRELGLEPGPELRALEQAILRHEVDLPIRSGSPARRPAAGAALAGDLEPVEAPVRVRARRPLGVSLLAGAAVVVVAIAAIASQRPAGAAAPSPSPSPDAISMASPVASGSPTPSPTEPAGLIVVAPDLDDGKWQPTEVAPGRWTWERFQPRLVLTAGSTWWAGMDNADGASLGLFEPPGPGVGSVVGEIDFVRPQLVLDKPCYLPETSRILDAGASSFIDWVESHPLLDADVVRPFNLGRYAGLMVDVRVARPKTSADCPEDADSASLLRRIPLFPAVGHTFPLFSTDRARLVAVDVEDGPPIVIIVRADQADWDRFIALAQPVLESITVER